MTMIENGTGTGTGTPHLRPSAPGTGPNARGTEGDSPTAATRDSAPGTQGTVPGTVPGTTATESGDRDTRSQPKRRGPWQHLRDRRDRRDAQSLEVAEQRAVRDQRDRDSAAVLAAALDAQRAARRQSQRPSKRRDGRGDTLDGPPIPAWMQIAGLWLDRTVGSLPLVAPLCVSGYFTYHVGYDTTGLALPAAISLALTLALEGGVWKVSRLYEKSLVAGYSTIALRGGIGVYLAIISGIIYWHATNAVGGVENLRHADWRPATAVALMSALGVFIWSRQARWSRRAELEAAGKMDTQAIKFNGISWLFTPVINLKVMRHAVKYRIDSTLDAVRDYRLWRAAGKPKVWPQLPETDGDGPLDVAAALRKWGLDTRAFVPIPGQVNSVPATGAGTVPAAAGTVPPVPVPVSPAPAAPAVPTQFRTEGTVPSGPSVPSVPAGTGTGDGDEGPSQMITLANGEQIDEKTLLGYAERHRVRYATVIGNLPYGAHPDFNWMTCPLDQITTEAIKHAGGFAKQGYASEVRKLIFASRAGYDLYATV